jgi:cytoskeletal protein CcmA (bactofilin family)
MLRRAFGDGKENKGRTDGSPAATGTPLMSLGVEGSDMATAEKARDWNTPAPAAQAGSGDLNALLGRGSEFDGKLAFEGTVRIDGTFTGEITTSDTLIVGDGAKVTAEITCGTILVHGEVNGNITASQAAELHKPARVKGDVTTPSLMVERGVVWTGRSQMEDTAMGRIVPIKSAAEGD